MSKAKTLRGRIKAAWRRIPEAYRIEIISVTQTFIAVFGATFVMFVQASGATEWSTETFIALITGAFVAAARAGVKAVWVGIGAWITARAQAKK